MAIEPAAPQIDRDKIERGIRLLLEGIGEDPEREGLVGTPNRVARMWEEFIARRQYKCASFSAEEYDEMVLVTLPVYSLCEHHLVPFFGKISVGYIPKDGKVLGLSKICRIVEHFALRPTIQERLTAQVAKRVQEETDAIGVGVIMEATHLCMSMRGVQKPGHVTTTSKMIGAFMEQPETRQELLELIK